MTMQRTAGRTIRTTLASLLYAMLLIGLGVLAQPVQAQDRAAQARSVEELEAIDAVKLLQRAYGYYLDRGFWDEAADLFVEDASFEYGIDGVYLGRERIREYIIRASGGNIGPGLPYGQLNQHMQLQGVVHVAPDGMHATGRWRELALVGQFLESAHWGQGVYENDYVKQGGVWKIAALRFYPDFLAPYEGGWASLDPAPQDWRSDTARAFPPDRAPTLAYRPYPDLFSAPFHFSPGELGQAGTTRFADEESRRIAVLRSRRELENLQAAMGYYLAGAMWDEAAGMFARDGTYEWGMGGVYRGPDHIARALALTGPAQGEQGWLNIYTMMQPIIDVAQDNRTALARWRSDGMLARDGQGMWAEGTYEIAYANQGGRWKIASLRYYPTYLADYDAGWSEGPIAMSGPSETVPPDSPPSSYYASFPATYIAPFHYPHPVAEGAAMPAWPATSDAATAALRERIERLEDHDAIEKVQRAYGYYVDKNLWTDVANLFATDGTVEIGGRGIFVTRPHILEYLQSLGPEGPSPGFLMNHQQLQGVVTVDPDGAHARGRWTAFVMAGKAPDADWGLVTYENTYVKRDGIWQIAALHAPFQMYTHYAEGWGKFASPITRPDAWPPPPDYAPSVLHNNYPSYYVEPFHYPNPVTGNPMPAPHPAAGGAAPMDRIVQ